MSTCMWSSSSQGSLNATGPPGQVGGRTYHSRPVTGPGSSFTSSSSWGGSTPPVLSARVPSHGVPTGLVPPSVTVPTQMTTPSTPMPRSCSTAPGTPGGLTPSAGLQACMPWSEHRQLVEDQYEQMQQCEPVARHLRTEPRAVYPSMIPVMPPPTVVVRSRSVTPPPPVSRGGSAQYDAMEPCVSHPGYAGHPESVVVNPSLCHAHASAAGTSMPLSSQSLTPHGRVLHAITPPRAASPACGVSMIQPNPGGASPRASCSPAQTQSPWRAWSPPRAASPTWTHSPMQVTPMRTSHVVCRKSYDCSPKRSITTAPELSPPRRVLSSLVIGESSTSKEDPSQQSPQVSGYFAAQRSSRESDKSEIPSEAPSQLSVELRSDRASACQQSLQYNCPPVPAPVAEEKACLDADATYSTGSSARSGSQQNQQPLAEEVFQPVAATLERLKMHFEVQQRIAHKKAQRASAEKQQGQMNMGEILTEGVLPSPNPVGLTSSVETTRTQSSSSRSLQDASSPVHHGSAGFPETRDCEFGGESDKEEIVESCGPNLELRLSSALCKLGSQLKILEEIMAHDELCSAATDGPYDARKWSKDDASDDVLSASLDRQEEISHVTSKC